MNEIAAIFLFGVMAFGLGLAIAVINKYRQDRNEWKELNNWKDSDAKDNKNR